MTLILQIVDTWMDEYQLLLFSSSSLGQIYVLEILSLLHCIYGSHLLNFHCQV